MTKEALIPKEDFKEFESKIQKTYGGDAYITRQRSEPTNVRYRDESINKDNPIIHIKKNENSYTLFLGDQEHSTEKEFKKAQEILDLAREIIKR